MTLRKAATHAPYEVALLPQLDTFDNAVHAQRVRKVDDGCNDIAASAASDQPRRERTVHLDTVDRQAVQILQAGIAATKIIECDGVAGGLERFD